MDLYYPKAKIAKRKMKTQGKYAGAWPQGAIVHFTAGRRGRQEGSVNSGVDDGYCYFFIDGDGTIWQAFPLDSWGYHAGTSKWPGLGSGVSKHLVGIEVAAAGKLEKIGEKFKAWFHKKEAEYLPESEVRYSKSVENISGGYYEKYTPAQEKSLQELLLWMHKQNPSVFKLDYVLGHDEVAPDRKNDPGAALSMTMPKYREHLKLLAAGEKPKPKEKVCPTCNQKVA